MAGSPLADALYLTTSCQVASACLVVESFESLGRDEGKGGTKRLSVSVGRQKS